MDARAIAASALSRHHYDGGEQQLQPGDAQHLPGLEHGGEVDGDDSCCTPAELECSEEILKAIHGADKHALAHALKAFEAESGSDDDGEEQPVKGDDNY